MHLSIEIKKNKKHIIRGRILHFILKISTAPAEIQAITYITKHYSQQRLVLNNALERI